MQYVHHCASPLGGITLSSDGEALTGLWFDGQKHFGSTLSEEALKAPLPVFDFAERWLSVYFGGSAPSFSPPLRLSGTAFQKEVWEILTTIPYGNTVTYGDIAQLLAARRGLVRFSAQAVGQAVARNPVSIIVPCHRVLGAQGRLTGYAAGTQRKLKLLQLENAEAARAYDP